MAYHHLFLPAALTILSLLTSVYGYQHPHQVLHNLKLAHDTAEELRTNPEHELFTLYNAFKELTPERVYRELTYLVSTTSASNGTGYKISESCANQTIFTMESMRMPTQKRPNWAANSE